MIKYFTIPGYGGSGNDHWQTYFDTKIDNCKRIQQDSWDHPVLEDWVDRINETLQDENLAEVIVITHSLGGIAFLEWVKKYKKKIKGAFLVAPPDIENPYEDLGLGKSVSIPQFKLPFPSIVVCSSNDHWMNIERSRYFANVWGSELSILDNAGHINGVSGYGEWNEGIEILKKLSNI